jgi:hypothetical protein
MPPHSTGAWRLRSGLIMLLVTLALAGCGKKNAPGPPPDEPNTFPRTYPSE